MDMTIFPMMNIGHYKNYVDPRRGSTAKYFIILLQSEVKLSRKKKLIAHFTCHVVLLPDLSPVNFLVKYFSFQPVLHDWCNKGCICYPVCGMVHIKEPMLLIGKSSPCGGSGFPFSLSEWSFTIIISVTQ